RAFSRDRWAPPTLVQSRPILRLPALLARGVSGGTRPGHEGRFEDLPARGGAGPRRRATRGLVSRIRVRLCPDECVARGSGGVDRRAPSGGDRESLWDDRVQPAHCLGRIREYLG